MQNCDYYDIPLIDQTIQDFGPQFLTLLDEEAPDARSETVASYEEAIRADALKFSADC